MLRSGESSRKQMSDGKERPKWLDAVTEFRNQEKANLSEN
jgi:hypothetical protein